MLLFLECFYGFSYPSVFQRDVTTLGACNLVLKHRKDILKYLFLFIFYNKLSNFVFCIFMMYKSITAIRVSLYNNKCAHIRSECPKTLTN